MAGCSCTHLFREYHENLCNGRKYGKFGKLSLAFTKQISFGSWPVNFETLSIDKSQLFDSLELCPFQVFKFVIYIFMELCCFAFYSVVAILSWTSNKCTFAFMICLSY